MGILPGVIKISVLLTGAVTGFTRNTEFCNCREWIILPEVISLGMS